MKFESAHPTKGRGLPYVLLTAVCSDPLILMCSPVIDY